MSFKKFYQENKFLLANISLFLIFFFYSYNTYLYVYDGHHHGLIFSNALDLLKGKEPYKEIFIQYGLLTTFFHSLVLKLFGEQIIIINIFTIIIYLLSVFLISLTIKNLTNEFYALIATVLILFNHPIPWLPWPNYLAFFFIVGFIYLHLAKKPLFILLSGFLLGLACLARENYIIFVVPSLIFMMLFLSVFEDRNRSYFKKFILVSFGFILPLLLFSIYLFYNGLAGIWLKYFLLPFVYIQDVHQTTFLSLIKNFITFFASDAIFNFISKPQYLLITIILIVNSFFLFNQIFLIKNKKFDIIFISIISLLSSIVSINFELFRLYTSVILGIIIVFYLINQIKDIYFKKFFLVFLSIISIYSIIFYPSGNNKIFIKTVKSYKSFNEISYFKKQKWAKNKTDSLSKISKLKKSILKNCNIDYSINMTFDTFNVLALDLNNFHIIPYRTTDVNKLSIDKYFTGEDNYFDKINQEINNQNLILLIDENNYLHDMSKINLSNYSYEKINLNSDVEKPMVLRLFYPTDCLN